VVGGVFLAALADKDEKEPHGTKSTGTFRLSSAVDGLGPKGADALSRMRDAAVAFALAKAVATVEEVFPGFKEHFERAPRSGVTSSQQL